MPVIRSEDAPAFALPHLAVVGLAAPSRGSSESSVWRITIGTGAPGVAHSLDREEIFVALAGRAIVETNDEQTELRAGDTLVVPAGQVFALSNPGPDAFEALALAPAGVRAQLPGGEFFVPPWTA